MTKSSIKQIVIFTILITAIALFRLYSGFFMKPILRSIFAIPTNFRQKDDFLKLMHQFLLNFASELVLWPDTYSFKLVTIFLNSSIRESIWLLTLSQLFGLVLVYKIFKKLSSSCGPFKKLRNSFLFQNLRLLRSKGNFFGLMLTFALCLPLN